MKHVWWAFQFIRRTTGNQITTIQLIRCYKSLGFVFHALLVTVSNLCRKASRCSLFDTFESNFGVIKKIITLLKQFSTTHGSLVGISSNWSKIWCHKSCWCKLKCEEPTENRRVTIYSGCIEYHTSNLDSPSIKVTSFQFLTYFYWNITPDLIT